MNIKKLILVTFLCSITALLCLSQDSIKARTDTFNISGQLSLWTNFNSNNPLPVISGGRYIPTIDYGIRMKHDRLFDLETSANISGSAAFHPFDTVNAQGSLKPYRLWIRYSSGQFELRLGLQKISFGSAAILRPLMWFDQMDPRDPLQLTDGVWALLARYYFLDNANIWLWGLYGNNKPRGWDIVPTARRLPEFGGRVQIPVPGGEAALSYNHRTADNLGLPGFDNYFDRIPEDRIGFDAKWDLSAGLWVEGSWTRKGKNLGIFTNQEIINTGIDYTFGIGSGLYTAFEQLIASYDEKALKFRNRTSFSLFTLSYPVSIFDKLSGIIFYDWTNNKIYNFVSWQKQFDKIMFYVMGYWNPESYFIPAQSSVSSDLFSGKGIQLMFVYNH